MATPAAASLAWSAGWALSNFVLVASNAVLNPVTIPSSALMEVVNVAIDGIAWTFTRRLLACVVAVLPEPSTRVDAAIALVDVVTDDASASLVLANVSNVLRIEGSMSSVHLVIIAVVQALSAHGFVIVVSTVLFTVAKLALNHALNRGAPVRMSAMNLAHAFISASFNKATFWVKVLVEASLASNLAVLPRSVPVKAKSAELAESPASTLNEALIEMSVFKS